MFFLHEKFKIESNNVRKFTNREQAFQYLSDSVFKESDFIKHVTQSAEQNKVSYMLAYDLITNHLTDILYEIDKNIINPRKKIIIRVYQYFSLRIGFMLSSTQRIKSINKKKNKRK